MQTWLADVRDALGPHQGVIPPSQESRSTNTIPSSPTDRARTAVVERAVPVRRPLEPEWDPEQVRRVLREWLGPVRADEMELMLRRESGETVVTLKRPSPAGSVVVFPGAERARVAAILGPASSTAVNTALLATARAEFEARLASLRGYPGLGREE